MKILWDLYPNHPLLLETSLEALEGAYVQKIAFGREGKILDEKDGHYANFMPVYQEFAELNRDDDGAYYHHCPTVKSLKNYEICQLVCHN